MKLKKISKFEIIFLSFIILLGAFLRLYKIQDTAMFLGDQGRDAIIAKNILKEKDIALIGPVTSVGNMYLGPFYYYFMVPWLALTYPNPIGPAIGVALVGIATIPLLYFITKKMFSQNAAVFSTILFSISSVIASQARFSWNPNLAPTFGLLLFFFLYQILKENKYRAIIWATICFAILTQLHYMAMLTGGVLASVVLYKFVKDKKNRKSIFINSFVSLLIFLVSLVPLIIFDIRHDYINKKAFLSFLTSSEEHIRPFGKIISTLGDMNGNAQKLTTQMFGANSYLIDQIGIIVLIISLILFARSKNNKQSKYLLIFWNIFTIAIISLYSSSIFSHYISFTYAISSILIGSLLAFIFSFKKVLGKIASFLILTLIIFANVKSSPVLDQGGKNIENAKKVSQSIYKNLLPEEKYNIVLISGTGDIDAQNYRYFLETTDHPPVKKENRGEVESLYIIQEDYFDTNPTDSPIYEIVVFPNKEPYQVYTINDGPIITVLKTNHEK